MEFEVKMESNHYVSHIFEDGKYSIYDEENEEPVSIIGEISIGDNKIGWFSGYELYNDNSCYEMLDCISRDCQNIGHAICNDSVAISEEFLTEEADFEKIFILDHIEIDEEYRNKGIGTDIIKNLSSMLHYQFAYGSNIFLCASDYESAEKYGFDSNEYKKGCQRLKRFYKKCGFKIIKDNIMVYNAKTNKYSYIRI